MLGVAAASGGGSDVEDVPVGEVDGEAGADLDTAGRGFAARSWGVVEGLAFELEGKGSQSEGRAWVCAELTPMFRSWPWT